MKLLIDENEIEIDLLRDFETINRLEAAAGVRPDQMTPTPLLLALIATWLESMGITRCTPSIAWQVWWLAYEMAAFYRKHFEVEAELSFWYSLDAFRLSEQQKVGLRENLVRVKAQYKLENGQFDPMDHIGVYNLTLSATGDEAAAVRARAHAQEAYLNATTSKQR